MKRPHPTWRSTLVLVAATTIVASTATPFAGLGPPQDSPPDPPPTTAIDETELPPIWYAAILRPGPKWVEGLPPADQAGIDDHLDHLVRQFQGGSIVLAGPFLDDTGALAVLRAGSVEEAKKIADSDPSVKSGLLKVEHVHPWLVPLRALVEPRRDGAGEGGDADGASPTEEDERRAR